MSENQRRKYQGLHCLIFSHSAATQSAQAASIAPPSPVPSVPPPPVDPPPPPVPPMPVETAPPSSALTIFDEPDEHAVAHTMPNARSDAPANNLPLFFMDRSLGIRPLEGSMAPECAKRISALS